MTENSHEHINDIFVDARNRASAKKSIEKMQEEGLFATFPFASTDIVRSVSHVPGFWEYGLTHQKDETLPTVYAGVLANAEGVKASHIGLVHTLLVRDGSLITVKLGLIRPLELEQMDSVVSFAYDLYDPHTQHERTVVYMFNPQTNAKVLNIQNTQQGTPIYKPIELITTAPSLFDENEIPDWAIPNSVSAVLDMPKTQLLIRAWQTTLHANMTDLEIADAIRELRFQIISTNV
jgi:hypothetical protein